MEQSILNAQNLIVKEKIKEYLPVSFADSTVTIDKVVKNNSQWCSCLKVVRKDSDIVPILYLNEYYDLFESLGTEVTLKRIADNYLSAVVRFDKQKYKDTFSLLNTSNVIIELVNYDSNALSGRFKDTPFIPFLDLAICFKIFIEKTEKDSASARITNTLLKHLDISIDELLPIALANTERIFPSTFRNLTNVIVDLFSTENDTTDDTMNYPESGLYIGTNTCGIGGASVLLYPNYLEKISEKFEKNLIILPSSIHEILILADAGQHDPNVLVKMVTEVNEEEVLPTEFLSNHVYYYNRLDKKVTILQ